MQTAVLRISTVRRIWVAAPSSAVVSRKRYGIYIFQPVAFLTFVLCCAPGFCQTVETLIVDFTKKTTFRQEEELIRGTLYFQAPEDVIIKVVEPAEQWNIFQGQDLLIYYPSEQKAFRFISRNRLMVPFAQSFIGLLREDFGLSDAGFLLTEHRKRANILITVWTPPRSLRSYVSEARVGIQDVHPLFLEFYDPQGNLLTRVTYLEYRNDLDPSFPGRTLIYQRSTDMEVRDDIRYFNHRINKLLPMEITDFALPKDVAVEELKW